MRYILQKKKKKIEKLEKNSIWPESESLEKIIKTFKMTRNKKMTISKHNKYKFEIFTTTIHMTRIKNNGKIYKNIQ